MVLIQNKDQPGVIGTVGTEFGDASVNIADMVISRESATALMLIKTDSTPPDGLLNRLRARPGILRVRALTLPARRA
jgi:D-3-phosphoglycerate dehydrogenase